MSNCFNKIRNYSNFLSNNDTQINSDTPMPHPLFFSETNCGGTMWPEENEFIDEMKILSDPNFNEFHSLYIPANWQTFIYVVGTGKGRLICSSEHSLLIENIEDISYDSDFLSNTCDINDHTVVQGTSVPTFIDTIEVVRVIPKTGVGETSSNFIPTQGDGIKYETDCWKYQTCNNEIETLVGAKHLTSWKMGSEECDLFMGGIDEKSGWCGSTGGYTCQRSPNAMAINLNLPACACLKDESDLNSNFCQPGNTSEVCESQGNFKEYIPVTCFGKNCSLTGYRFNRMQNQQCNMILCEQTINLIGDNIVVDTDSTIYCGTKVVDENGDAVDYTFGNSVTVSPSATDDTSGDSGIQIDTYLWALIVTFSFVLLLIVPLSIILFRRSKKEDASDVEDKKEALLSNVKYFGKQGLQR